MPDKAREKRVRNWVDRNLWSVPSVLFLLIEFAFSVWSAASRTPVLLAAASLATRQLVYSSLTSSSSAVLGIALAIVAAIVAFGPRIDQTGQPTKKERNLARARMYITGSLLAASFFMLVLVITSTVALAVDSKHIGNSAITTLIEAAGIASTVGLLVGGAGLALVIVERSWQ